MVCRLADATRPFGFATSPPDALTGPVLLFPRTAQSSRTVRSRSADNSDCPEPGTNPSLTSAVVDLACRLRSPPASGLDRQPRTFAGPERPVPRESATTSISCCWVVIPHRARCHLYRHVRISPTRFGISARPHAASGAISLTRRGSPVVRLVDRLATAVSVIAVPGGAGLERRIRQPCSGPSSFCGRKTRERENVRSARAERFVLETRAFRCDRLQS